MQSRKARFRKSDRLLNAASFDKVFKRPRKSADNFFSVLWRSNGLPVARLGLAISKKSLKRAVDRNRVKRIVRESFRLHQGRLVGFDIVVLSRRGLNGDDSAPLRDSLRKHWEKIAISVGHKSSRGKVSAQRSHFGS